jgi:hypothetical protein
MSTHSVNKNLLLLRERLVSNLYEKVKTDREIAEEATEILVAASTITDKARNEQELIAVFDMIAKQLEIVSEDCETFGNEKLGYIQRYIASALYECIESYLPHNNISKSDLIKILWPHNCWDIASLKNVFLNYIFENALILGVDDIFVDEFISAYKSNLDKTKKFGDLIDAYNLIREEARVVGTEHYKQGNYNVAWKYSILSRIIGFLLSDFKHCASLPTGTFKWVGFSSVYL